MTIELKTGLVCDQGLKRRLALDERKFRDVPIGQLQEIESAHAQFLCGKAKTIARGRSRCS
jgi:hypothetical protein